MPLNERYYKIEKNPFELHKDLHSKIKEYEITAPTKEKARDELNKGFEELVRVYGEGLVRNIPHIFTYVKDSKGNIVCWVIKGKFVCYIPEKTPNNYRRKNEGESR